MKGYIYALYEDNENDIFYIGASVNPENRLKEHRTVRGYNTKMSIIEEIEFDNKNELFLLEVYWIHQFKEWGFKLKNEIFYRNIYPKKDEGIVSVRLKDLKDDLQEHALTLGISFNSLIVKIMGEYVEKLRTNTHD